MSITHKAFKGASWLALFRAISQTVSWAATIIIARILVPEDYGLMEMATILTGYVSLFSELGLGASIIQRENIKDEELSSLFWFAVGWGCLLAISCIGLAYPTAAIFNEGRIVRLTQSVSLAFILVSLLIVPLNILQREMRFKTIGLIEACSVIISSAIMVVIAKLGGGVWTLIGGFLIKEFVKGVLIFSFVSWRPTFRFHFNEIKPYIKYGLKIATANSLYYVYTKSDRFFAGRILGTKVLGYYSLALQLADIPTEKLVSLINSVSFPVFSRYQKDPVEFNNFFLKLISFIGFITFPLYIGGIFIADQLILTVFGAKWLPIILPFKLLCISQLIISITTASSVATNALGYAHWNLYLNLINVIVLPLSFSIAAKHGLNYLVIPWLTINPMIRLVYVTIVLRKLGISISDFFRSLMHPLLGTIVMVVALVLVKYFYFDNLVQPADSKYYLFSIMMTGVISYAGYVMAFRRNFVTALMKLWKAKYI